jgi:formamidase
LFSEYYLVHWEMRDGWVTSAQLPGIRIPDGSFMGTAGLAPSRIQLETWTQREVDLCNRGGLAALPENIFQR